MTIHDRLVWLASDERICSHLYQRNQLLTLTFCRLRLHMKFLTPKPRAQAAKLMRHP